MDFSWKFVYFFAYFVADFVADFFTYFRKFFIMENDNFLSITELNFLLKNSISEIFTPLKIHGEISNFIYQQSSGHCYFSLKDKNSQIRCTIWKFTIWRNSNLKKMVATLKNGKQINVLAKVNFYEVKGEIQLNIEDIFEPENQTQQKHGELFLKLQNLRQQLFSEGLFDIKHKKNLPNLVENIAIVTSSQTAALQDILRTLQNRTPFMKISIFETPVQGSDTLETAQKIVAALQAADSGKFGKFDAILICRGGGSVEDLWAFNEEILARAIFAANTPIISGIGHEIDTTLADDVADIRAATPTAAAQEVSKFSKDDLLQNLQYLAKKLNKNLVENLQTKQQNLDLLQRRIFNKTSMNSPNNLIKNYQEKLQVLQKNLAYKIKENLFKKSQNLQILQQKLTLLNPENVLQRGYVYVSDNENQYIFNDAQKIKQNAELLLHFKNQHNLLVKVIGKNFA